MSTDANCNSGDFVKLSLCADAMDQIRKDLHQSGTDANLPSTTGQKQGNLYFDTDMPLVYRYSGSAWVSQPREIVYAASASASGTTYTATCSPPVLAYKTGMLVVWKVDVASTGAVTLNLDGLGAKSVKASDGSTALTNDDLLAAGVYTLEYDGTNFRILSAPDGPWTAITGGIGYSNSWADNGLGLGYENGGFMKDGRGRVWLRGLIKPGTTSASTAMFTLPAGYRPHLNGYFTVIQSAALSFKRVTAFSSGVIEYTTGGTTDFIDLSGITFSTRA